MIWFILYVTTIFAANWAIAAIGVVPVGFGLMAPAAVYFVGLTFSLRDAVQESLGRLAVLLAILIGAGLSAMGSGGVGVISGVVWGGER